MFAEKTLAYCLFTWLYSIYPESNRSRIACVWLVPDPERIRIQNLQNRIGSGLKKSVRTPLIERAKQSLPLEVKIATRAVQQVKLNFNLLRSNYLVQCASRSHGLVRNIGWTLLRCRYMLRTFSANFHLTLIYGLQRAFCLWWFFICVSDDMWRHL